MPKDDDVTKLINLKGVKFKDIDTQEDSAHFLVSLLHDIQLGPTCLIPTSRLVDVTPKKYRDLDLLGRSCYIEVDLRRFECKDCFCTFTETLPLLRIIDALQIDSSLKYINAVKKLLPPIRSQNLELAIRQRQKYITL